YKLIQDIEAEDHILGPLTLRQFIYGLIAGFLYYICFILITKHIAFLLLVFLPVALFLSFLAFPFKRDQPTEVWALAKLHFILKPKRRIWSQSGIKELVTITAPKKVDQHVTNHLSATEIQNRLQTLALTIDTRGWATKNVSEVPDSPNSKYNEDSDRLISPGSIPKPVPDYDVSTEADMFDDLGPQAKHANDVISQSMKEHRQQLMTSLGALRQQDQKAPPNEQASEDELTKTLKQHAVTNDLSTSRLHRISEEREVPKTKNHEAQPEKTNHIDPAILNFALNNNGLSVQSLAHEANLASSNDEVVVNLH
ncbi:MAG: PrgI family protein, partial [Candidatus Saccharimonadales bacterium]